MPKVIPQSNAAKASRLTRYAACPEGPQKLQNLRDASLPLPVIAKKQFEGTPQITAANTVGSGSQFNSTQLMASGGAGTRVVHRGPATKTPSGNQVANNVKQGENERAMFDWARLSPRT
eukprot:GHVT01021167.1.p3 GENE.GHVT01021167.1~~GHVT01021167.1.p3  ORF type:complete len:119 (-),score=15.05 GHVT01021167.1:1082-1438(-)